MRFVTFNDVADRIRDKAVVIVGSAPSCVDHKPGFIDSHQVVVRVNAYKLGDGQGRRTDMHYSFYGNSIKKDAGILASDGVKLCLCKCPDSKPLKSDWHERNNKQNGIDFRYIYKARANWWFCDTFIPDDARFLEKVALLQGHIPTTGFSAILDVLACKPGSVYLTGFDFFRSGIHNVNEPWRAGDPSDPIGHRPQLEARWLTDHADEYPLLFDKKMRGIFNGK